MKALAVVLSLLPSLLSAQSAVGTWQSHPNDEGIVHVRIAPCGAALCGAIVKAVNLNGESDPAHPYIGRRMIWDMMPDEANSWSGGKIWDPIRDRTFSSKMEVVGDTLNVSGCFFAICEHYAWQTVK